MIFDIFGGKMRKNRKKKLKKKNEKFSTAKLIIIIMVILVAGFMTAPMLDMLKRSTRKSNPTSLQEKQEQRRGWKKRSAIKKGVERRIKIAQQWIKCSKLALKKAKKAQELAHLLKLIESAPIARPLHKRYYLTILRGKPKAKFRIIPITLGDLRISYFKKSFHAKDRGATIGGYIDTQKIILLNSLYPLSCVNKGVTLLHEASHAYYAPAKNTSYNDYLNHNMKDEIRARSQDYVILKALGGNEFAQLFKNEKEKFLESLKRIGGFKFSEKIPKGVSSLYSERSAGNLETKARFMQIWTFAAFTALDTHFGKLKSLKYKISILRNQGYQPH